MAFQIKPTESKPLVIEYGDKTFELPGRIPSEFATVQGEIRIPVLSTAAVKEEHKKQVGTALLAAFYNIVVPEEAKSYFDLRDLGPVFEAWSEHVELGKDLNSKG